MGLFGYNQTDYAKNSAKFNDKLMRILEIASVNKMGTDANSIINAIMMNIDRDTSYPKGAKGKDVEAIDARIDGLLDEMSKDVQKASLARLCSHATMALNAVTRARRFGMEYLTPQEIKAEQVMGECKALIRDALKEKGAIVEKQEALMKKSERLPDGHPDLEILAEDWEDLEHEKKSLEANIEVYRNRHDANLAVIDVDKRSAAYKALPEKIVDVKEFDKMASDLMRVAVDEANYVDTIVEKSEDALKDVDGGRRSSNAGRSAFHSIRAARQENAMENDIENATVEKSNFSANNPFASKLKR